MSSQALLDIVIVNWNTRSLLGDCLTGLLADDFVRTTCRIVVVDNASSDDSFKAAEGVSDNVHLTRLEANLGFGMACNIGAASGAAPYILFLNPDTTLPEAVVGDSVAYLAPREGLGALGIRLIGEDGATQRSCTRFPTLRSLCADMLGLSRLGGVFRGYRLHDWAHDATRRVDHVIGAYYLVRRDLFDRLGGFDERFFVYLEDLDLSRRIAGEGLAIEYVAELAAEHIGGGSSSQILDKRLYYSVESRWLYAAKHLGTGSAVVVVLVTLLAEFPLRLVRATLTSGTRGAGGVLRAWWWLVQALPAVASGTHSAKLKARLSG